MTIPRIFVAGSVQTRNLYAYGTYAEQIETYNEAIQIQAIVDYMLAELQQYNVEVYRTTLIPYMDLNASAKKANDLGCTSYYAIHSNAGGGQGVTALKQTSLYTPKAFRDKSAIMATELCASIESLGRHNRGTYGKRTSLGREWYSDLRQPKMPATIVEIEFHDWSLGAIWIINNKAVIGKALAQAIVKVEGLTRKAVHYTGTYPTAPIRIGYGTTTNVIRWQKYLCWYGVDVVVDGHFGRDTEAKTKTFQRENGLVADGMAGNITIAKAKTVVR